MKKRVLKFLSLGLVMAVLAGCGDSGIEDAGGDSVVSTGSAVDDSSTENEDSSIEESSVTESTEESSVEEPTYTEGTEVVLLDNVDHNVKEEDWIDVDSLSLIEGENRIVITKEMDIYHIDGLYAGYAKVGARPAWIAGDEEWNTVTFEDGVYLVKTSDLTDAMMLASEYDKQNQIADNTNSEPSGGTNQNSDTTVPDNAYTVTDMSKTMYAKQSVNVRSGPNSDYERLGGLSVNQEVTVTGQADTGWYRITYNGGEAYVSNSYLSDSRVEVATTQPETGNGGDTSPAGSNVPSVGGEVPSQPVESASGTTYTEAEVIAIVENTLRNAGMRKPEEDMTAEELAMFGPTDGMGWGIGDFSMTDPQTDANELLKGFLSNGGHYYYIENLGSSNGYVSLKVYADS